MRRSTFWIYTRNGGDGGENIGMAFLKKIFREQKDRGKPTRLNGFSRNGLREDVLCCRALTANAFINL